MGSRIFRSSFQTSIVSALIALTLITGCATAPKTEAKREELGTTAEDALKQMKAEDPALDAFLSKAHAYVVFPSVGKGGYIVGGSYGRGLVYANGIAIGYADISQATFGLQIGGQTFMEILALESSRDLDRLKAGKFAPSATASAVILKSGAAATAKYSDGVAVFVKPIGGAMLEASIGAQQFTYQPK